MFKLNDFKIGQKIKLLSKENISKSNLKIKIKILTIIVPKHPLPI